MNGNGNENENGNENGNENREGNDNPRPTIRPVPRTPRRNSYGPRRPLMHYRVENFADHLTINNNYIMDVNNNVHNRRPPNQPHLALPVTVYGPHPSNAYAGNQHTAFLTLPPIPYIPSQTTHIALPLTEAGIPAQIANGTVPPVRIGLPSTSRVVHAPAGPQIICGAAPHPMRFRTPMEPNLLNQQPPQIPVPNAYIVTPDGTYLTVPPSIYAPPPPPIITYVPMPSPANVGNVTFSYANTGQRIYSPVIPITDVRIFEGAGDLPSHEDEEIAEFEPTNGTGDSN